MTIEMKENEFQAKISDNGQIFIPAAARKMYSIKKEETWVFSIVGKLNITERLIKPKKLVEEKEAKQ